MDRPLLAVALAALLVLAGCSAVQINRPDATETDAPTATATAVDAGPSAGDGTEAADSPEPTGDADEATDGTEPDAAATSTPEPDSLPANAVVLRNDGASDVLVDLTLADGPATAYKVRYVDGSVAVTELGDVPVGTLAGPSVVDLAPIEPVRGSATYEVDAGETRTGDLPDGESWTTLVVEVTTTGDDREDREDRRVLAATRLACSDDDTPGRVRVNVTADGVRAAGDCLD